MAHRRLEHQRDQPVVVEVVADDDHRRTRGAQRGPRTEARRAIDDDECGVVELVGQIAHVVDRHAGADERVVDDATDQRVAADAHRAWRATHAQRA